MFATIHKLSIVATIVTAVALGVFQVPGGTSLPTTAPQPGVADLDW